MTDDDFKLGDVLQFKGAGVPKSLEPAFFRVVGFGERGPLPSLPFRDQACTVPFNDGPLNRFAAKRA